MLRNSSGAQPNEAPLPSSPPLASTVTLGAILLFVGTASSVLATVVQRTLLGSAAVDRTLEIALILNIAVILFGWRRHQEFRRDVMLRLAADDRARALAAADPLTGLLTRRALTEQGAALIAQGERRNKTTALLVIDIDHFRTINDLHGHAVGDAALRQVGDEIAAILPAGTLIGRLGGDSFAAALLFDAPYADPIERLADQLCQRLAQPLIVDGRPIQLGASIGIARSAATSGAIDTLLRSADIAVSAAKSAGRNRFMWFDESMERELSARNETEANLRIAIPQQQIVPFFEQQIDLTTGRLRGFEVLARWEHPMRGLVSPDQFIQVAEESGLIADLSMAVMHQAFQAARDWNAALTLTVNIAPSQLRDPWLAQKILKLLAETGFPAQRLEIDITEAALFTNLSLAQGVTASLKNQGIRVALDDFGTGYSSIAHLRAILFDRIKIDRSFITTLNTNPESAAVVTAITRLAESLNLPVTAEGIEDEAIEARVRALGCDRGQGYRYGRPMHARNARGLLAERRLIDAATVHDAVTPVSDLRKAG